MKPQPTDRKDPAWVADIAAKRIVYAVSGMDRVEVRRNIVYKRTDQEDLQADVYLPPGLAEGECRPAVFFIHGGSLPPDLLTQPKEWGTFVSYGQLAAVSGFIAITFNHRYYGIQEKDFEQSTGDVEDAIAYFRGHAGSFHVDPQRICLWAFSGGGPQLVAALREPLEYVRCIVSYYAVLNFNRSVKNQNPGIPPFSEEVIKKYSPARCLNEKNAYVPPVFIARAGHDNPYLNESVDEFVSRAFACGVNIEVCNHPAGRHSFDILDDDARSREIIARTIEFIRSHLFSDRLNESRLALSLARASRLLQKGDVNGARSLAQDLRSDKAGGREMLDRVFSETALNGFGNLLLGRKKTREAVAVFEWVVEEHPYSPGACDSLGNGYEASGRNKDAVQITAKALQLLENAHGLHESLASSIRISCESRLKRLQ